MTLEYSGGISGVVLFFMSTCLTPLLPNHLLTSDTGTRRSPAVIFKVGWVLQFYCFYVRKTKFFQGEDAIDSWCGNNQKLVRPNSDWCGWEQLQCSWCMVHQRCLHHRCTCMTRCVVLWVQLWLGWYCYRLLWLCYSSGWKSFMCFVHQSCIMGLCFHAQERRQVQNVLCYKVCVENWYSSFLL